MLQQNNGVKNLIDICMDKIVDNYDSFSNEIYGTHLEYQICFTKHKRDMDSTFRLLNLVNKSVNKPNTNSENYDKTIYKIKYLKGEDFFSYDHLVVRYNNGRNKTFTFIQM
jgi:hypothetical protein